MKILRPYWQGIAIVGVIAVAAWLYLSPEARECKARGGSYYLNGDCGEFVWQPR